MNAICRKSVKTTKQMREARTKVKTTNWKYRRGSLSLGFRLATVLAFLMLSSPGKAASNYPFVPTDFDVPSVLETKNYRLRMLTVNDLVKDFDAVISSSEKLREVWPHSDWPLGLTLEENLIDLGWHQREFTTRRSFAYTVVALDETKVLGCVYINPTRKKNYDAEIYLWTRTSENNIDLTDEQLMTTVENWVGREWPFLSPAFPGKKISWDVWNQLDEESR